MVFTWWWKVLPNDFMCKRRACQSMLPRSVSKDTMNWCDCVALTHRQYSKGMIIDTVGWSWPRPSTSGCVNNFSTRWGRLEKSLSMCQLLDDEKQINKPMMGKVRASVRRRLPMISETMFCFFTRWWATKGFSMSFHKSWETQRSLFYQGNWRYGDVNPWIVFGGERWFCKTE